MEKVPNGTGRRGHTQLEHELASRGAALSNNTIPPSEFLVRCAPSPGLIVSCGCVIVDPAARKVAIVHDPDTGITQLPKGRKNIGEDIHAAALREAHEETGIPVALLALRVATRATPTEDMLPLVARTPDGFPEDVTTAMRSCEPVAVCHHRCPGTLAYKLVFWYVARGDSSLRPVDGTKEAWEEHYQVEWVDARAAAGRMSVAADGEVIQKAIEDMVASGYDI
ncbi:hypothetical protein E5D57_001916 [Metarhizium anisopliae]|nr:hypothetical protein E5D57_001916 [Metarhizium anisopliae]